MTRIGTRDSQAGFSLIELMVAMVATMVIAGAVFKLMTAGNSAFRREPEMSDRQQNIRLAMDILGRDIYRTGSGVPEFVEVFSNGLDGVGPTGSGGQPTDEIEMIATSDCGTKTVCKSNNKTIWTLSEYGSCFSFPTPVILVGVDTLTGAPDRGVYWAPEGHSSSACGTSSGAKGGLINLPPGQSNLNKPSGVNFDPQFILVGEIARYRIAIDADGVPNLQRSNTGGIDVGGLTWQTVARGIEDMQVEYLNGIGWNDEPGVVACSGDCTSPTQAELDAIVRRVRIRLSARADAPLLQGATTSAVGDAVRGELVSEFVPKAAQIALSIWGGEM